ncbi:MAG: PD-(D/E)XK nuclease family protein, partial [Vicinamibacteria bacterium]
GQILRGAIDSLLLRDRRVVVIDFKTGGHRAEHRLQIELYLEAARDLFPAHDVEGVVFYARGEPLRIASAAGNAAQPGSQMELF